MKFPLSHYAGEINLKTQQSPVIFDLCLRKTRSGKSRDYRDVIVFEKLRFQHVSLHSKTQSQRFQILSGLKNVFEMLRFHAVLAWTVSQAVEIKLCFQISPA